MGLLLRVESSCDSFHNAFRFRIPVYPELNQPLVIIGGEMEGLCRELLGKYS